MGLASLTVAAFDRTELLISSINSEAAIREAAKKWIACVLVLTTLQDQTQFQNLDGTYVSTDFNHQLQMMDCILLLAVPRHAHVSSKITIVKHNCALSLFLLGEWHRVTWRLCQCRLCTTGFARNGGTSCVEKADSWEWEAHWWGLQ
jgi:hypothetical protein